MPLHSSLTSQACSRPTGSTSRRLAHGNHSLMPLVLVLVLVRPSAAWAAASETNGGFDFFRQPAALVLVLGLATLVPFAFMALTAFVKISTVLQIV